MYLVLGGNGFVGQHTARWLVDHGETVTVTAYSRTGPLPLLQDAIGSGQARVARLDLTDPYAVMALVAQLRPRAIIDLSGHPPKALSPARDVQFRTAVLLNLLEAARAFEVSRVVLMSSMDVYWGLPTAAAPYHEDDPVPLLESDDHVIVQSWVKKSLEVIGNLYRRQHGMAVVFVRASGIYGPLYRTWMNVPSRLVRSAAGHGWDGPVPAAASGYDQVYVRDAAEGIGLVATAPKLRHAAYNIGSGGVPTYGAFAAALARLVPGFDAGLTTAPPTDPMDGRWMAIERAATELGYAPRYDLDTAMADYLAYLRHHGV